MAQSQDPLGFKCTDVIVRATIVQLDTSECTAQQTVVETGSAGGQCFGITKQATSATNQNVPIIKGGTAFCRADGSGNTIAVGEPLKSNASGVAVLASVDADEIIGFALQACTTADTEIIVDVHPMQQLTV